MSHALYQPQILTSIKPWYHMMSCDNVTARYLNNFIMDFLKIVNSSIIFIAQVISQNNIPHRSNCHKMKRKTYHTVRTVIKLKTKYTTHVIFLLINYSMNEILPFRKSYCRLVLANFHCMLKSNQKYSFCIKLEREIILWNKNVDLSLENNTLCLKIV